MSFLLKEIFANFSLFGQILFLIALIICNHDKISRIEWYTISIILFYIAVDLAAIILEKVVHNNMILYNTALPLETLLVISIYYPLFKSKAKKNAILITIPLLAIFFIADIVFYSGLENWNVFALICGLMVSSVFIYMYLKQEVENIHARPQDNFIFWFSSGMLLDNCGSSPMFSVYQWIGDIRPDLGNDLLRITVMVIYLLFFLIVTFGLLWTKRLGMLRSS